MGWKPYWRRTYLGPTWLYESKPGLYPGLFKLNTLRVDFGLHLTWYPCLNYAET